MLWNLPANEQYSAVHDKSRAPVNHRKYGLQAVADNHLQPDGWLGKMLQWVADKPTDQFKKGMHRLIEQWTPATIVPEHGDVRRIAAHSISLALSALPPPQLTRHLCLAVALQVITEKVDQTLRQTYSWVKWDH